MRAIDNAEHTITECEEWNAARDALQEVIRKAVSIESMMVAMCSGEEGWQAVNRFAQVIGKKEEDEKLEQQRKRQEARQRISLGTEDDENGCDLSIEEEIEDNEEEEWEDWIQDLGG